MSELDTKLRRYMHEAVGAVEPVTADEVMSEATSRRRARRGWMTPALTAAAVAVAALVVVGVGALLGRPGDVVVTTPDGEDGWVTYRSAEHRFEISYPRDWNRARESLTPDLVDPSERLTLTTGSVLVGGDRCRTVPEHAMNALERDGILITLQVRGGGTDAEFPPKPDRFSVDDAIRVVTEECAPEGFWHKRFDFREGGRAWYVYVTVGPDADRDLALRVLDSFQPDGAAEVVVPDVEGMRLADAVPLLEDLGLRTAVAGGHTLNDPEDRWSDPDGPQAVVVNQTPPAGTAVPPDAVVGFRTAVINEELCAVLTGMPVRDGDADQLARTDGYWQMLRDAQPYAQPPLDSYIDMLLDHEEQGTRLQVGAEDLPPGGYVKRLLEHVGAEELPQAVDSVKIHHRACHP